MKIILFSLFFLSLNLFGRVHDFQTTRLKSTAGAGVGSVLLTEGGLLNPAPIAVFNYSTLHVQKSNSETKSLSKKETQTEDGTSMGLIFTDSKNKIKGAIGYFKQQEGDDRRKRFSFSVGNPIGKRSSYGVTYRYTTDISQENRFEEKKYHQAIFGASHIVSDSFSVGAIVVDPSGTIDLDRKVVVGIQYTIRDILALMVDVGTDYEDDPSATLNYAAAIQLRVLNDLYFRAGLFNDKKLQEKGNGLGVGWASPKFIVEIASKLIKPLSTITNNVAYKNRQRETAFSLTMRF